MSFRNNSHPALSEPDRLSETEKADLICLGLFPSSQSAHQAGTEILIQNFWYAVFPLNGQWGLYVRSAIAEEAAKLVKQALKETNTAPPFPRVTAPPPKPVAPWHLIPAPLFLMIVFGISTSDHGSYLVQAGRFDSLRIHENWEWWRLISPLFLHADMAHLSGNILGGLLFGGILASRIEAIERQVFSPLIKRRKRAGNAPSGMLRNGARHRGYSPGTAAAPLFFSIKANSLSS